MARPNVPPILLIILLPIMFIIGIVSLILNSSIRTRMHTRAVDLIKPHAATLARKKKQLIYRDDYGREVTKAWERERTHFINSVIRPDLSSIERMATTSPIFEEEIERQVQKQKPSSNFNASMPPVQYEHYCAEILRQAGWSTQVTKASGDQGGDVIGEANGVRLVLQCKLINGSVGNKAVQEVSAARLHYECHYAAVVTHIGYTTSAKQLAATNGVYLLQHDSLKEWAEQLAKIPTASRLSA